MSYVISKSVHLLVVPFLPELIVRGAYLSIHLSGATFFLGVFSCVVCVRDDETDSLPRLTRVLVFLCLS